MADDLTRQELPQASDETKDLLDWLRAEREIASRARYPFLRLMHLGLRVWAGDHYANLTTNVPPRWEERYLRPEDRNNIRKIDDQTLALCRYAISGCSQNMPSMRVEPATIDEEDKLRAAFGTRILRWGQRITKEAWQREQELLWLVGAGEVLRRTSWDPGDGGHLFTEVVNPFLYMKDPHSIGKWPPRYIIEEDARHIDEIKSRYGATVEPDKLTDELHYLNRIATAVNSDATYGEREEMKGAAMVTRLTVPPSARHKRGRTWVFCNEKLLDEHELQAGQFPYSIAIWYEIAGRLYPKSLMEMVLTGQMELNHLVSLLYEAAVRGVRGDIILSGMNPDIRWEPYDDLTGAMKLELGPGVDKFEVRNLMADWQQAQVRKEDIVHGLKEKAGTSEPSLGQALEKEATAYEIGVVKEANQQGIQWHLKRYADYHLTRICMQELELLRRFVVAPRVARSTGGEGLAPEELLFSGSDLAGCDDVIAVPQPYMSPAMRQQAKFQMWQAAIAGDWQTLEQQWKFRRMLLDMGFDDIESEVARVYGSMEELG
jgi:hypothetical protein